MDLQPARNSVAQWNELRATQALNTWRRLLMLGPPQAYPEHVSLFSKGDEPRDVFLVARGIVKLACDLPDGKQSVLTLRYPGQFVEECAYDLHIAYPVSAFTITPCELYRLDVARMREAEKHDPEVNAFEREVLKRDLYNLAVSNVELKVVPPVERFERFLWELATVLRVRRSGADVRFVSPLDNREMAELLGLSESHYKQVRSELEATGRLRREEKRIFVLKGV